MRFTQRTTVAERREQPLADFLFAGELAHAVCQQLDISAGALILDHLVACRWPDEAFKGWLLRQVREILAHHVQTDDWQDGEHQPLGTRVQRTVESIELSDQDLDWLIARFARHPEVLAVWEEACRQDALIRQVADRYGKLTDDEIKTLVVDDKWLATLAAAVQAELDRVSQTLTGRIRQLAECYADPLPKLADDVETLSAKVATHLRKMGFTP